MADINKINWFPGHMAKSLRLLDDLKYIDLIIEVVDARAVSSSSNPMLKEKFGNKPVLTIALKTDLAIITKPVKNILYGSIYEKKFKNIFLKSIERELQEKKQRMINKGLVSPTFNLVVVGLPNIGKSSIINFLSGQTKAHAENKPGVTRKNTLIKINKELMIYDTPGIMVKNIIDIDVGYRLSLIGVINQNILPMRDVLE
jgi:ribosome biogenesis GTPase A